MARAGQGRAGQARSAAADQALRAVRLQRLRPARSVQAAQDRAARRATASSRRTSPAAREPLEALSARVAVDGRHARARARACTRSCARPRRTSTRSAPATIMGQNFGVVTGITRQRNQAEGTGAGRRRRLDRALEHAAICSRRTQKPPGSRNDERGLATTRRLAAAPALAAVVDGPRLAALVRAGMSPAAALRAGGEQHRAGHRARGRAPAAPSCSFTLKAPPANPPAGFAIASPPRIALDFLDTSNALGANAARRRRRRRCAA